MQLADAVEQLRSLVDASFPLAVGVYRDAQARSALKLVIAATERTVTDQMERDELELAVAELHDLLEQAADVLDAQPGPFEPDGSWDIHSLARRVREVLEVPASALGEQLLSELIAARAWRDSVRVMATACDYGHPEAAKQWGQTLRIAEQAWQAARSQAGGSNP